MNQATRAFSVCAAATAATLAAPALAGRIVASHDVNTFSSSIASRNEAQLAVNIASYLAGEGGDLLLIESSPHEFRDYSDTVIDALVGAGFSVTVDIWSDGYADRVPSLESFDAVFFGVNYGIDGSELAIPDVEQLHNFVDNGGGAYVFGGNGPNAAAEAEVLNEFLVPYGAKFSAESYDGVWDYEVDSDHEIFAGLQGSTINAGIGNGLIDLDASGGLEIVQYAANGSGVIATLDVPAPGTAAALLGLAAFARRRR
ncbi:MAG: hypothetical protein AAGI53_16340 [Planctomycetota bacterium]